MDQLWIVSVTDPEDYDGYTNTQYYYLEKEDADQGIANLITLFESQGMVKKQDQKYEDTPTHWIRLALPDDNTVSRYIVLTTQPLGLRNYVKDWTPEKEEE